MKSIKESLEAEKEQKVKLEKVSLKTGQCNKEKLALAKQSAPFLNELYLSRLLFLI